MLVFKSGNAETFYEAAELKYREASVLVDDELHIGACYLLGYVIEMIFKCAIAEIGYPAYEERAGRNKIKDDFGHDLLELHEGLIYMLSGLDNDDYREILEQLDADMKKSPLKHWSPNWRYLENVETIRANGDGYFKTFDEQIYEIFLNVRAILVDHCSRR